MEHESSSIIIQLQHDFVIFKNCIPVQSFVLLFLLSSWEYNEKVQLFHRVILNISSINIVNRKYSKNQSIKNSNRISLYQCLFILWLCRDLISIILDYV